MHTPFAPSFPRAPRLLKLLLGAGFAATALATLPTHAALVIGNNPLYLVIGKANVLITLDNSNSMDENAAGSAVGSNAATSKSEIARSVVRSLTDTYRSRINMGLMAYKQGDIDAYHLHNSPYDASFNPADYDAAWTGARAGGKKKYRLDNPTSPGNYVHYNVALPFYSNNNLGNAFCYSITASAAPSVAFPAGFNNGENPTAGPWDNYRCFQTKTGSSNTLPTWNNGASEAASGFSNFWFESRFNPTDSDFAQGILDFGRYLTWNYVGRTWFRNDSPGRGYLHVPLGDLNAAQAATLKTKLACNVPGNPGACTNSGIPNAALTPIEGTLLTARDYYKGGWNTGSEGYTAGCYPLPESCRKNFVVLLTDGLPSTNKNGTTLSNPVTALAEAAAAAALLKADGVETYIIGFALPYGTDPTTLNQIAVAGGTDVSYLADDAASLQAAFDLIFEDIFKKTSAFGAVSQNSTSINTGSAVYQGRFDSTDWSGEVVGIRPDANGGLLELWNTSTAGLMPNAAARKVFTLLPGTGGREFKLLTDLNAAQQAALATTNCSASLTGAACAQARIDWLRGDKSLEIGPLAAAGNPFRRRTKTLGDVISSSPYYVKSSDTMFIGANDGMLHAFNAATGAELFAFVPNAVVSRLYKIPGLGYSHEYFVDGDIAVSGTYETPGKNILVGSLGRGGKALYALDVTDPANFNAAKVLWEFTDPDLGLVLGKPVIAKLNNGKAAVLVGNGYNSASERSFLFVIDIETGALIKKIDTGTGSAANTNGMASPRGWDLDGNGTVDIVYAGDLLGNLWKFDLSGAAAAGWASSFTSAGNPAPMFVAVDSLGVRQPITGMIGLGMNGRKGDINFGKRFVFFGSGRYITTSDVSNKSPQSWYGIIDNDTTTDRASLKLRAIDLEGVVAGNSVRAFSQASAGDMAGKRGWVIDMVSPATGALGERMLGEHKFFGSVLLASSMIPDTNPCLPGGEGYLNAIDPFTGASVANPFFDANNDSLFDDTDRLGAGALRRSIGSVNPGINLPSDAILIGNRLVTSGTSGNIRSVGVNNPVRNGRISWREAVTK